MKAIISTALIALFPFCIMAQKKQFTLDDLIPGGETYYQNTVPENRYLEWHGDDCVMLDVDKCSLVDRKTGAVQNELFTLDGVNSLLIKAGRKPVSSLLYCSFPFTGTDYVLVGTTDSSIHLIDLLNQKVVWSLENEAGRSNVDCNYKSLSVAYTKSCNLFVRDSAGVVRQITDDGSADIVYGESVHRNEFGISKGTYWSPSGKYLAFYRMDQSMVTSYPQVNVTPSDGETRCATLEPDKYPMAGEISHKVTVGVYDLASKSVIYLDAGDPTDCYFTNIAWGPDEKCIYMQELNRDQTCCELVEYDASTGTRKRVLFTESNDKYVEPQHPIQFVPWDNSRFIHQSRRDGYNHIYLYDCKTGNMVKQLTRGEFEVLDVLGFCRDNKSVIFASNEVSPIQQNIFKVNMSGKRTLLGNNTGWHNATLSPTGRFLIDNSSSPLFPRHIDVIQVETGWCANIFSAKDKWADYNVPKIQTGTVKAADDVTDLYYRLILPPDFDPAKKYPAIVYVYGGPHAHNIDASRHYGARGWDIYMAQKGYVMFCLDNRGSENRGIEFEQATFRQLGVEEMKDQIRGVDFLKALGYVDSTRIGVHGWSFGGFMTTSLMTTYPDVFKCGVAGGPVIDWKYYEVMYGERYMDTPQTNPEGYARTSLLGKAGNLKGRLMIIYGGNDPVCVPQHTLSFIRACIDAGTYPDLFTYPGSGHNMHGTERVHLHQVITRYFEEHLK